MFGELIVAPEMIRDIPVERVTDQQCKLGPRDRLLTITQDVFVTGTNFENSAIYATWLFEATDLPAATVQLLYGLEQVQGVGPGSDAVSKYVVSTMRGGTWFTTPVPRLSLKS